MENEVSISDVEHIRICGGDDLYCGHPRHGGLYSFEGNELALVHYHAPCAYQRPSDVHHEQVGYMRRAKYLMQRSLDGGKTWPEKYNTTLFDRSMSLEKQREWLNQRVEKREAIDMSLPDSMFVVLRAYAGDPYIGVLDAVHHRDVLFIRRSKDRGHTWEEAPIVIRPVQKGSVLTFSGNYLKLQDGSVLLTLSHQRPDGLSLSEIYCSEDNGISWYYLSTIGRDIFNEVHLGYPTLLGLPDGKILCTLGALSPNGVRWNSVTFSDDNGLTWREPKRITRWGTSPYPVLLDDGRVLMVYAWRETEPYGIRGKVSDDLGETWSKEFIIRGDAAGWDLGYPVATQLANG
ncbi:MAG: exo-alpha-sialidase, partial [Candidatus Thorarchaeota archaeon]